MDQPAASYATQPIDREHAIHGAGDVAAWTCATAECHSIRAQTEPVRKPGGQLDRLVAPHIVAGPLPPRDTAARLSANPGFNPTDRPFGPNPGF